MINLKKTLKTGISIALIMILTGTCIYASSYYDMQKINVNVKKPMASFKITYETPDGKEGEICSDSKFYPSDDYNFDITPRVISLPKGTKIEISDLSTPGAGDEIKNWDFQIYMPKGEDLYQGTDKDKVERKMTLDEVGTYEFYLSVMDDYMRVNGCDNWSVNGNHRWLASNPNNKSELFYWYFTQANIIVREIAMPEEGKDNNNDDNNESEDDDKRKDENEDSKEDEGEQDKIEEDINHNPETEILVPDVIYPDEITNSKAKTNIISWYFYDEDRDKMKSSSYKLYKIVNNKKILIDEKENIEKQKDCLIELEGKQKEKFFLVVSVTDQEDNSGSASKYIEINEFMPKIKIMNSDRTYIDEQLGIDVDEYKNDEINSLLYLKYNKYEILDEEGNVIDSGKGKINSSIYVNSKIFKEDMTYKIIQEISNINGKIKVYESSFYIVPIMPPKITIDNLAGYYNETIKTNLQITQEQSKLKGELEDYNYEFKDKDCYFEIYTYDLKKLILKKEGMLNEIILNETFNIDELKQNEEDRIYKVIQYATNGKGKTGSKAVNLMLKKSEEEGIKLEICQRDNDSKTISNEIYRGESLLLKTNYFVNKKIIKKEGIIENANNETVYNQKDIFNGLTSINLDEGKYKITSQITLDDGKKMSDSCYFEVKKIEQPVIDIKNEGGTKYTRLDTVKLVIDIKDINQSEEHPNGFMLSNFYEVVKVKNEYEENEEIDKIIENANGTFKEMQLKNMNANTTYKIIQHSKNVERDGIESFKSQNIGIINLLPEIEIEKKDTYYKSQSIAIRVCAIDKDGYVKDIELENCKVLENTKEIENFEIVKNVYDKKAELVITFEAKEEGAIELYIKAIDNDDGKVSEKHTIKIKDAELYSYIDIENKNENENENENENKNKEINEDNEAMTKNDSESMLKENRYIRIRYGNNKGIKNNLKIGTIMGDNKIYKEIVASEINEIYENDEIKIMIEKIEEKTGDYIAGLYFKKAGKYELISYAVSDMIKGEEDSLNLNIKEDKVPEVIIETEKETYRNPDSKKAKLVIEYNAKTDDDIEKINLIVDGIQRKEITEVNLVNNESEFVSEFECNLNELGLKELECEVIEKHNFLPKEWHPFYNELKDKIKIGKSNKVEIEIKNARPSVTYNFNNNNKRIRRIK